MVVPTGTSSPWREITTDLPADDEVVYLRDGWTTGSADVLAEALRADGVVRRLSDALRLAEDATLETGWYGYVDDARDEVFCDEDGFTDDGREVYETLACVYARITLPE